MMGNLKRGLIGVNVGAMVFDYCEKLAIETTGLPERGVGADSITVIQTRKVCLLPSTTGRITSDNIRHESNSHVSTTNIPSYAVTGPLSSALAWQGKNWPRFPDADLTFLGPDDSRRSITKTRPSEC
jgi:hypothetical protein